MADGLESEVWEPLRMFKSVDYEGMYEISNCGRIKSVARWRMRGGHMRWHKEKVLSTIMSKSGYETASLYKDGISATASIHRLVAEHFIKNPDNKPQVNHIDGNKKNNFATNLEWCDARENSLHAYINGLSTANKSVQKICLKTGEILETFFSIGEASRVTGIHFSSIGACCNNKRKTAGKYGWRFA